MIKGLKYKVGKSQKNIKYFPAKYNKKKYFNHDPRNQNLFNSKNVYPK